MTEQLEQGLYYVDRKGDFRKTYSQNQSGSIRGSEVMVTIQHGASKEREV